MLNVVLSAPCRLVRGAKRLVNAVFDAAEAIPRIAGALEDVRTTLHHVERLAAYVAEELPELAYQLENLRKAQEEPRDTLIPESPRTG